MPDWLTYTIIGFAVLFVMLMAVLIMKKKIVLGSIEIGWPPKITFVPQGGGSGGSGKDEISARNKGKIGDVDIVGAADNFSATADDGEIGGIKIKRKM